VRDIGRIGHICRIRWIRWKADRAKIFESNYRG